jgi:hypothetical protein
VIVFVHDLSCQSAKKSGFTIIWWVGDVRPERRVTITEPAWAGFLLPRRQDAPLKAHSWRLPLFYFDRLLEDAPHL